MHFSAVFNSRCSRPETASDVISSLVVEHVGMDVLVKFDVSRSNSY